MATANTAQIMPNSHTHIRYYPRTAPAGLSASEVEDWNKLYYREQYSISSSAMSISDHKDRRDVH